jgi:hypothetical protein
MSHKARSGNIRSGLCYDKEMSTFPHHQTLIQKLLTQIQPDPRYLGLAAGGSWSDKRLDQWSDLDLILFCEPQSLPALLATRVSLAAQLGVLLESFSGQHLGDERLLICLFGAPLMQVGLKWIALPDYVQRVEDPELLWERDSQVSQLLAETTGAYPRPDLAWIEARFWVWVHHGILKLGRGELLELADHLGYLRNQVLGPLLLMQYGHPPRRVRRVETDLPPEALARLLQTLAKHEREAQAEALLAAISLYRDLRAFHGLPVQAWNQQAEKAVMEFFEAVRGNRPVL